MSGRGLRAGAAVAVAAVVLVLTLAALTVQAVRGNRTVGAQRSAETVRDAVLDDAFYACLAVQAHSLVSPGQTVALADTDLGDVVTLLKGVGGWITVADPPSTAQVTLSLRNDVRGRGACLGTVVVARYAHPVHGAVVRVGSGSSVPGTGPPPAPPL